MRHGSVLVVPLLLAGALSRAQSAGGDELRKGFELYRAGNCLEAAPLLNKAVEPKPLLGAARCYFELGNYASAELALLRYRVLAPGDEESAILLARVHEAKGDFAKAAALLQPIVQQAPQSLAARDALAEMFLKGGQRDQAAALYQAVLKDAPTDVGALAGSADLAAHGSQWQAAVDLYKRALAVAPENPAAVSGMGLALVALGQVEPAIASLQRALVLRAGDWELSKALASCYLKTGRWSELIQTLEFNSAEHGDDEKATDWMAQAYMRAGDAAGAEKYYRGVLQKFPQNVTARLGLGNLLYDGHRPKEAKTEYLAALKARPDLPEINDRLGQMAEQEKQFAEARDYYAAACRSAKATPAMRLHLARATFQAGDMAAARTAIEAALRDDPANREARMMLVQVAVKLSQWDEAARLGAELLAEDKNNLALLRLLGETALRRKREPEAADYMERALAANGKDRELRLRLAQLYTDSEALNRQSRAIDLLNEYVTAAPDDPEGYLLLANLYRRKSDTETARQYFERGFSRMPVEVPVHFSWAYSSFGIMLFGEKRYEDAVSFQVKAVELDPKDDQALYNLALTYLQLRRQEELAAAREKLRQMGSPLLEALEKYIEQTRTNGR